MEVFKESWKVAVFSSILALIVTLSASWIVNKGDKVGNAASREYVDEQDDKLQANINGKADKDDMVYIRGKVDAIYLMLIEKNNAQTK